jgi:hypothetical protein
MLNRATEAPAIRCPTSWNMLEFAVTAESLDDSCVMPKSPGGLIARSIHHKVTARSTHRRADTHIPGAFLYSYHGLKARALEASTSFSRSPFSDTFTILRQKILWMDQKPTRDRQHYRFPGIDDGKREEKFNPVFKNNIKTQERQP